MSASAAAARGGAITVSSVPGRFFFICTGDVEDLERAGGVEPIHDDAEDLRVHVVDLAFDDGDAIRVRPRAVRGSGRRARAARSACPVGSRSPAP